MISMRSASDSSGEYSRIGTATIILHIARQRLDDVLRHIVEPLDLLRQHGADARHLVRRQPFERLDRERAYVFRLAVRERGHEAADLPRKLGADIVVRVVGEMAVGMRGRGDIRRDGTARRWRAFLGKEVEDIVARIGVAREFVLGLARALSSRRKTSSRLSALRGQQQSPQQAANHLRTSPQGT